MDGGAIRVRSLKIRAEDGGRIYRAVGFLEEAFRTASLSGLPPNADILVRRLDLGPIRLDGPVSAVAALISEQTRDLAVKAVRGDRDTAGSADVVWFADRLQAYQVLLHRLLDGRQARQWYWKSLFPGWRLTPGPACVGMLLLESRQTSAGQLAPCHLLQSCLEPSVLSALIAWLAPEIAERLLRDLDLFPGSEERVPGVSGAESGPGGIDTERLAPPWRHALGQATRAWGAKDSRVVWFAASALLIHQPGYLEQRESLRRMLYTKPPEPGPSPRTWWATGADREASFSHSPAPDSTGESPRGCQAGSELSDIDSPDAETGSLTRSRGGPRDSGNLQQEGREQPVGPVTEQGAPRERETRKRKGSDGLRSIEVDQSGQDRATRLRDRAPVSAPETGGSGPQAMEPGARPRDADAGPEKAEESTEYLPDRRPPFSDRAGFAYLVPLLQRIGLAELLSENDRLLELGLARHLLMSLARRLLLDRRDPNWELFELWLPMDLPADVPAAVGSFVAPGIWWRMAGTRSGPLQRYRVPAAGKALITAPGGRWPLFYGDDRSPDTLPLEGLPLVDAAVCDRVPDVHGLSNAVQLVAGCWLRSRCGLSLRSLVRRPGRVAISRTHWDTIFDLDQSDLRLRRIALDTDPGWVPWLGKVVQFHFGHYE